MIGVRGLACVLWIALPALMAPSADAVSLQPSEDGMSLAGIFHAKLDAMHAKNMGSESTPTAPAPSSPGKGRPGPPPPPTPKDDEPCFQGGDDCSDYESTFDPCTKYNCNRDERRCIPEARQTGTPCGLDGDYYFGECNSGPGFCKEVESKFGNFGICVGIPKIGIPCNDFDQCTKDDKCKVVITDDGLFRGQCMGTFAGEETSCNDYNDRCTDNDRCQLISTDEGDVPVCRGDLIEEGVCNDYNICTEDDKCIQITPRFDFDAGIRCRGTFADGKVCNDYNECTDNDMCTEVPDNYGDYGTFATCRGEPQLGRTCEDYNPCTDNDQCTKSDYGDFTFCRGSPAPGSPCEDYNSCTGDDVCVLGQSGDYAFCEGSPLTGPCDDYDPCSKNDMCITETFGGGDYEFNSTFCRGEPTEGGTCTDFNDCTEGDTCVLGQSGDYSFCQGSPTAGGPCNDYNDCTASDACVLGTSGDYAFCEGTPTPGEPCNDYNEYTTGDMCVASDYGFTFCEGMFGPAAPPPAKK